MRSLLGFAAVPTLAVMSLAAAPAAEPQVQATVVMKSGERHTGVSPIHRYDRGEFALRKGQSDEVRVPASQVAYVDFGGGSNVDPQISGSQSAVVLRDGNVVRGQLIEMGYTTPSDPTSEFLVIIKDDLGNERRLSSNQVARVYFPGGASAMAGTAGSGTTSSTPSSGSGLVVSAKC